jgi:hypothetical protein
LGNVNWTTPQAAQVSITQVSYTNLASATGADAEIQPNTSTVITVDVPAAKAGDPIFVAALDDYVDWTVYSSWCKEDGKVKIRFGNFTAKKVDVKRSQYKIVLVK